MEAFVIVGLGVAIYFIPTIIASGRSHPNAVAICVLNLVGGWTAIGWVAALVWSFTTPAKPAASAAVLAPVSDSEPQIDPVAIRIGQLERLAKLRAEGALTDQEYENEKRQLLS
jgi:hypothetical protein